MKPNELRSIRKVLAKGGSARNRFKHRQRGKYAARHRIKLLLDPGSRFVEDGQFAHALGTWHEGGTYPADAVITGMGHVHGQPVCVMANDATIKAGSWGRLTVEKIIRIQERAHEQRVPIIYLVDSAGARLYDQIHMFPGRRGAGRIFAKQARMRYRVPQACGLFGPSAGGGAYIPSFCDFTVMVERNASMYLGSPRMVEKVIGQKTTMEELGGARMHCEVSGCGHMLARTERQAIRELRRWMSFMPRSSDHAPRDIDPREPRHNGDAMADVVPDSEAVPFDMMRVIQRLVDERSWLPVRQLWAPELICGLARLEGMAVGILANQSMVKSGALYVESARKGRRFIDTCSAYNIPLIFLADVPGFMVGRDVERQGIIDHGMEMITAVTNCRSPKLCVIVRKAYGAGLYAMSGPGFYPLATLAFPQAKIAVMGAKAAVNAMHLHRISAIADPQERLRYVKRLENEYERGIDVLALASELVIDGIIHPNELRQEAAIRLLLARGEPT